MKKAKKIIKEEAVEELEIEQELKQDDISPIQDKVSKLFDNLETETEEVEESADSASGLDWTEIAETLNYHLNDPELEDAIMQDLHERTK